MMKWRDTLPVILLFVFGLSLGLLWQLRVIVSQLQKQVSEEHATKLELLTTQEIQQNRFIQASKEIKHSVVGVVAIHSRPQILQGAQTIQKMSPELEISRHRSMGSGIIIDTLGHILTNHHVIDQAESLIVHFSDGVSSKAAIVGYDSLTDLAIVRVELTSMAKRKSVRVALESSLRVGQWVLAVGNPYLNIIRNADPTVTAGVISALHRNFTMKNEVYYQDMIQTDAAINPGNSGGPLINLDGEVVGINTFIFSRLSKDAAGIGFSIPMERAMKIAEELILFGKRRSVWTGVSVELVTTSTKKDAALIIATLTEKSPADKAGLEVGDTLVAVEQRWVHTGKDLSGLFLTYFPGDSLHVVVKRGSSELEKVLTLEEYTPKR